MANSVKRNAQNTVRRSAPWKKGMPASISAFPKSTESMHFNDYVPSVR